MEKLYVFWQLFFVWEIICVVWLASLLASATACRVMERSQVRCGLVVKRVRRRREMRWLLGFVGVVPSVVVGGAGVYLLVLFSLLRRQQ